MASSSPRRVVILAFPGVQPLDVIGPAEVFAGADQLAGGGAYEVEVLAKEPGPIATRAGGYSLLPESTTSACRGPIDTLVVAGGFGVRAAEEDAGLIRWIRSAARRSRRVTSVCSGSFLLARAGLLEGRTVTTHWASAAELARRHPELEVDPEPIFVRDGDVWTSAGVTSGMDLSLALVEEDLGREIAVEIARWLVLFLQRPGGQAQFSSHLSAQLAERRAAARAPVLDRGQPRRRPAGRGAGRAGRDEPPQLRPLLPPGDRHDPGRLRRGAAGRASPPAARGSRRPGGAVASRCGFGTPETMRRAFARRVGVAPAEYRARFRRAEPLPSTA